jgi:hypothetical protein
MPFAAHRRKRQHKPPVDQIRLGPRFWMGGWTGPTEAWRTHPCKPGCHRNSCSTCVGKTEIMRNMQTHRPTNHHRAGEVARVGADRAVAARLPVLAGGPHRLWAAPIATVPHLDASAQAGYDCAKVPAASCRLQVSWSLQ